MSHRLRSYPFDKQESFPHYVYDQHVPLKSPLRPFPPVSSSLSDFPSSERGESSFRFRLFLSGRAAVLSRKSTSRISCAEHRIPARAPIQSTTTLFHLPKFPPCCVRFFLSGFFFPLIELIPLRPAFGPRILKRRDLLFFSQSPATYLW